MGNACTYNACHTTIAIAIAIDVEDTSHSINHSITLTEMKRKRRWRWRKKYTHSLTILHFSFFSSRLMHLVFPCLYCPLAKSQSLSAFSLGYDSSTFSITRSTYFVIYAFGFNLFIYPLHCNILPFQFIALEFCQKNTSESKKGYREKMARSALYYREMHE